MKTIKEINSDILKLTLLIQDNYPELSQFIEEMPVTIPNQSKPEISPNFLLDYYNSLNEIVTKYEKEKLTPIK